MYPNNSDGQGGMFGGFSRAKSRCDDVFSEPREPPLETLAMRSRHSSASLLDHVDLPIVHRHYQASPSAAFQRECLHCAARTQYCSAFIGGRQASRSTTIQPRCAKVVGNVVQAATLTIEGD